MLYAHMAATHAAMQQAHNQPTDHAHLQLIGAPLERLRLLLRRQLAALLILRKYSRMQGGEQTGFCAVSPRCTWPLAALCSSFSIVNCPGPLP